MPIAWPKPSWCKWVVRPMVLNDVYCTPSEAAGYCYSSRIMYVDKELWHRMWMDLYDANYKLWVRTLLMAAMVFGMTSREQLMIVAIHLIYTAIFFIGISNARGNSTSPDRFLLRRSRQLRGSGRSQANFFIACEKSALNSQFRTLRQIKLRVGCREKAS